MNWSNAALLFAVFAGHCELMACWCNRAHGLKLKHRVTSKIRAVHDAIVLLAAPGLLFGFGLFGHRLLRGGEWSGVPWGWKAYFWLCGAGVVSLLVCTIRHLFRPLPAGVRRSAERTDVAAALGFKPIGTGKRRGQAKLPGNGQFTLEAVELEIAPPGLPQAWDGATIGHLSDTHFQGEVDLPFFEYAFQRAADWGCDLYVFTGDLLDKPERVDWVAPTFGRLAATNPPLGCRFILGNHDWHFDPAPLRTALDTAGWADVAGRVETLTRGGAPLALAGDESPWLNGPPDWSAAPPGARARAARPHAGPVPPGAARPGRSDARRAQPRRADHAAGDRPDLRPQPARRPARGGDVSGGKHDNARLPRALRQAAGAVRGGPGDHTDHAASRRARGRQPPVRARANVARRARVGVAQRSSVSPLSLWERGRG